MTATLTAVRLPIPWQAYGLPLPWRGRSTTLLSGDHAWAWSPSVPTLPVADCGPPPAGDHAGDWDVDHVVLLVPDLPEAVALLAAAGADLRLQMEVRGRPSAFFRVGTVLEVIQERVRTARLFGVALVTATPLADLARRWRGEGHDVGDPRPAIQPGREIMTVRGAGAGLAVMSPNGSVF